MEYLARYSDHETKQRHCMLLKYMIYTLYTSLDYYHSDQIEEDEMGGTCRTHRRDVICTQNFSLRS
jgi:hypothetical protein